MCTLNLTLTHILIQNLHAMQVDSLETHTNMEESTRFICEDTH